MITIQRKVIKIARKPPPEPPGRGWPLIPGRPYNAHEAAYHLIEISGVNHVFMWRPSLDMWSTGMANYRPDMIGKFVYRGECTVVYRQPPVVQNTGYRRNWRR